MTPPSWDAHQALVHRVATGEQRTAMLETKFDELRHEMSTQYKSLMEAGAGRETHLSDKMDNIARQLFDRMNQIADRAPRGTKP